MPDAISLLEVILVGNSAIFGALLEIRIRHFQDDLNKIRTESLARLDLIRGNLEAFLKRLGEPDPPQDRAERVEALVGELSAAKSQIKDIEGLFDDNKRLFKYDIGAALMPVLFSGIYLIFPDTTLLLLFGVVWFGISLVDISNTFYFWDSSQQISKNLRKKV